MIRTSDVVSLLEGLVVLHATRAGRGAPHAPEHFAGRTVVVTGASAGVGRAVARAFGASGARVALLARGRVGLEAAAEEIERAGGAPALVQPEVAARAVLRAARHPRRKEYRAGVSTAASVLARRVAPGLLDRYIARTAYDSQQTDEPAFDTAPTNLWVPWDGPGGRDHGAHGTFDGEAAAHSPYTVLARRPAVAGAAAGVTVAASALLARTLRGTRATRVLRTALDARG
ncbi:hypothetical protein DEJ45_03755 [Streptomyces venezuelae]|uniref:SDR family NAD(P)-dependent oxidoreductase n=1 Tax=Streptomyces venezuelae TaxID=54571 RepID=UPI00123D4DAB|nr:SDR family NAD(P)-dependent oxidoreductase [Streptomyces venezuelae]QES11611.1 hypothetical protein DEJ45_03755 [Streptomyces venezuelae]